MIYNILLNVNYKLFLLNILQIKYLLSLFTALK